MLKINVGNSVKKITHKNQYELVTSGMSGDGDEEHVNSFFFDVADQNDLAKLEWMIALYEEFNAVPSGYHNDGTYIEDTAIAIAHKYNLNEDKCTDALWDMVGNDVTYDGGIATPTGWELFYWDPNGIKFNATVEIVEGN